MKKYQSLIITIFVAVLIIFGVFFLSKLGEDKYFKEASYGDYKTSNWNDTYVYIGSKEDKDTLNYMRSIAEDNSLKFKYIYTENLTDEEKEEVLGDKENVLITVDGKEKDIYDGDFSKANITSYLMEKDLLPKQIVRIDMNDYKTLLESNVFVVSIFRTGCGYCEKFKPVLNSVMQKYNIVFYYVDIAEFSNNDYNTLFDSAAYFKENEDNWGTPTTIVFKDGEQVSVQGGYTDEETFVNFLKEADVL